MEDNSDRIKKSLLKQVPEYLNKYYKLYHIFNLEINSPKMDSSVPTEEFLRNRMIKVITDMDIEKYPFGDETVNCYFSIGYCIYTNGVLETWIRPDIGTKETLGVINL